MTGRHSTSPPKTKPDDTREVALSAGNRAPTAYRGPMKQLLRYLAVVGLGVLLVGCNTFDSRAKEKSATFSGLDETTRDRLKERNLRVGDTFDMVYIALGAPDEKREILRREGTETTWIYNAYWQEYRGTALVGYRRYTVYNQATKTFRVVYEPVREAIYTPRVEERLRISFADGLVSAIEEIKT